MLKHICLRLINLNPITRICVPGSLQLVEYPSEGFQYRLMFVLLANLIGVFAWDRLMLMIFAPHVLKASMAATRPEVN